MMHERYRDITADEMVTACEAASVSYELKAADATEPRKSGHQRTADRLMAAAEYIKDADEERRFDGKAQEE